MFTDRHLSKRSGKTQLFAAAMFFMSVSAHSAYAQTESWEYAYVKATSEEEVTGCFADIVYPDRVFGLRFVDDEILFYFSQSEFEIPSDTDLGEVYIAFEKSRFLLDAFSLDSEFNTTDLVFLDGSLKDEAALITSLIDAGDASIVFPDGTKYSFSLRGSAGAIREAYRCWSLNFTGDFAKRDPFSASDNGKNPFDL